MAKLILILSFSLVGFLGFSQNTNFIELTYHNSDSLKIQYETTHIQFFTFTDSIRINSDSIILQVCFKPTDSPTETTYFRSLIIPIDNGDFTFNYSTYISPNCYLEKNESVSFDFNFPTVDIKHIFTSVKDAFPNNFIIFKNNVSINGNFYLNNTDLNNSLAYIFNNSGSLVYSQKIGNINFVDLSMLPCGTYFTVLTNKNGFKTVQKVFLVN